MSNGNHHSRALARNHTEWTQRLFYSATMAAMIGSFVLLLTQIIGFSASLDTLTDTMRSDWFIFVSRFGASLVVILVLKEVLVAFLAFAEVSKTFGRTEKDMEALPATESASSVSIIVPAFNEEETIAGTLQSLLAIDFPDFDIVVVDDGSNDRTLERAQAIAATSAGRVSVLTQSNQGKWSALNRGIENSKGELVFCIDSDSVLAPDVLMRMVPHFADPEVAAVSGQVAVRNRETMIARLQALEYLVANGSMRTAQSGSGCVLIVPGPIGLFRRSVLKKVQQTFFGEGTSSTTARSKGPGPFSPHTFAEDFELSVMICVLGGRIVYEPRAKAFTRVPDSQQALLNQRYRWLRGSMQVSSRFRSENWGTLTKRATLGYWIRLATILELYIVPFASLLLMGATLWALTLGELNNMLTLWLLVLAVHVCASIMFVRVHGESLSLALLTPLQTIYGAFLITGVWTHAIADHFMRREMKW